MQRRESSFSGGTRP